MNSLMAAVYKDIFIRGLVPYQYLYQRLKGRITGVYEFVLRDPSGRNRLYINSNTDEMLVWLDGTYAEDSITLYLHTCIKPRKELLKITAVWCIKYVWHLVKNIVKIGS